MHTCLLTLDGMEKRISRGLRVIWRSKRGATTAEYALILALVVVMLISTLTALGQTLNHKLQEIINQISNAS